MATTMILGFILIMIGFALIIYTVIINREQTIEKVTKIAFIILGTGILITFSVALFHDFSEGGCYSNNCNSYQNCHK